MKLEVFRRINQGGTPLSGQDIRLAYYGSGSPSLSLIRLAGIYDPEKPAAKRFIDRAKELKIEYPWKNEDVRKDWANWWDGKEIARGQTASESFLWAVISAQYKKLDEILQNSSTLQELKCRFNGAVDDALDSCCAQFRFQDIHNETPAVLMTCNEMVDHFFPFYESWIYYVLGEKAANLPVSKHRGLSTAIGAAYAQSLDPSVLDDQQWTNFVEFIRRPQDIARKFKVEYPQSKGRWGGSKGYRAQLEAVKMIIGRIKY